MRKIPIPAFIVFVILILSYIGYRFTVVDSPDVIASPLPDFLTSKNNNQVTTLNLWEPILDWLERPSRDMPQTTAKSVLVYDLTTNKAIFEKNIKEKVPIASLTKIMTAIVALENPKDNDKYLVLKENLVGENTMGLSEGEVLSLNELLYGLILHSGNDAAETIASNYSGGRTAFIKAMNDKAESLGLKNTNFTNPSGLEGDGRQYSTTQDLLVITKYALSNFPTFSHVVSTVSYHIPRTQTHKEYYLENETNLLTSYPGVKGVKTGYTPEAGFCLITYLDYGGHKIIAILLGSENRRQEMKDLLDYSLKSLGVEPPSTVE